MAQAEPDLSTAAMYELREEFRRLHRSRRLWRSLFTLAVWMSFMWQLLPWLRAHHALTTRSAAALALLGSGLQWWAPGLTRWKPYARWQPGEDGNTGKSGP